MPSGFLSVDTNFPALTGDTERDMKKILNYLFMLTEQLRYTLYNLSPDNFNENELKGFVDELRAGIVTAETVISSTVVTEVLYSHYGNIAELTVDSLQSGDKIQKYLHADTGDVNYIDIRDQTVSFVTARAVGGTVQLRDREGRPLFWRGPVTAANYKDVGMETVPTSWPVIIYDYEETVKLSFSFVSDLESGHYMPKIILGTGDGVTDLSAKAVIFKGQTGLEINYYKSGTGELRQIKLGDGGVYISPYELESLDFYDNGFSAVYSGNSMFYTWEKDLSGQITKLITEDNVEIPVIWHLGDM